MLTVDTNGNLQCPHPECKSKYDVPHLIKQDHDASDEEIKELHLSLDKLRSDASASKKVKAALEVEKRKMRAEFERIQKIQNVEQREVETLRLNIVDEILTLHCPRESCRAAFMDFDGCFALTCGVCRAQFCAWCTTHWNELDVHYLLLLAARRLMKGSITVKRSVISIIGSVGNVSS